MITTRTSSLFRAFLLNAPAALGGSAALEGVMMKAPERWALAVRLPDGAIHLEVHDDPALSKRFAWARWPLVRGVVALYDALRVSSRALSRSAELAGEEQPTSKTALYATTALSLLLGLFIVLPGFLAGLLVSAAAQPLLYNLLAGLIKAAILVGYLLSIGRVPEIGRFFMYHGAEHKAIAAYERGLPLTVENVQRQSAYHPRCGTTFIAFVILTGVLVYSLMPAPEVLWWRLLGRVLLLPLVAGLAFEVLRYSAAHTDPLSSLLKALGFRFQMLTVRQPTEDIVEVAIQSTQTATRPA
ncbi:DUF1385 domain-containing protein [Meiothermus granaticius]|uniref:Metal-dependent enzyme n=1 Tax=Meiothermus granaticius NBRC 107808 TaxID=1227551 RepID=A0A399FA13_9DEIN|nr:DUF1385 domain-containing protein [Meiothermus granaticius]MBI5813073.1 DUF1385 domain-containing protein [Allomeiothermus silvanus]MCL6526416.1 DUF1385 domain-containing protein [Thermaceae bacterium]RIH93487.1 hypothetical protein Mgrana_00541 [Meiothermus granaticius NBRC 107808]GEM85982.1 hypothetical protein MGR01S_06070 [Meiothermus granaticius NBRC 107808]